VQRNRQVAPMAASFRPRDGDRAVVAIYTKAEAEALEQLAASGWQPAITEEAGAA